MEAAGAEELRVRDYRICTGRIRRRRLARSLTEEQREAEAGELIAMVLEALVKAVEAGVKEFR
jgi:RecB family exonuclease